MIKNKIIVVIPAYNEEKTIIEIINKVKPLVNEIVVVDDGSSDQTAQLAEQQGVTVLRHLINRGQGAALQTGNQYALEKGGEIIVHFDADGQFLAEEIKDIVQPLEQGEAEVVFGSRFLEKKSEIPWFKRQIIIPLAHLANKLIIGFSLTDPQSGFRALSKRAVQVIQIENDGMAHCSEILYKVFKNNFKIKEVPITVIYHDFGQCFGGGIKIIKDLFLAKLMD
ncbi:glycosyltransferase family 2 protein [Patescibacteria group bacterium]|nr:glycosyltransferase family 2 protein [Patescibacteria group bacterium]